MLGENSEGEVFNKGCVCFGEYKIEFVFTNLFDRDSIEACPKRAVEEGVLHSRKGECNISSGEWYLIVECNTLLQDDIVGETIVRDGD